MNGLLDVVKWRNKLVHLHLHLCLMKAQPVALRIITLLSELDRLQIHHLLHQDKTDTERWQNGTLYWVGERFGTVPFGYQWTSSYICSFTNGRKKVFLYGLCGCGVRNNSMFRFWAQVHSRSAIHNQNWTDHSKAWGHNILHILSQLDHSIYLAFSPSFYSLSSISLHGSFTLTLSHGLSPSI